MSTRNGNVRKCLPTSLMRTGAPRAAIECVCVCLTDTPCAVSCVPAYVSLYVCRRREKSNLGRKEAKAVARREQGKYVIKISKNHNRVQEEW